MTYESAVEDCDCESARNFGQFNRCLKQARNLLRTVGLLDEEVTASLNEVRKACKTEKKSAKKGKAVSKGKGKKKDSSDSDEKEA